MNLGRSAQPKPPHPSRGAGWLLKNLLLAPIPLSEDTLQGEEE